MPVASGTRARRSTATEGGPGMARDCIPSPPNLPEIVIHSLAVLSFAGSVFRAAALGLLGLFLLTSIPPAAIHLGAYVAQAVAGAGEDSASALRRVQGDAFVDAIERIRWILPRDGEY